jgi:futalosine hydrolase
MKMLLCVATDLELKPLMPLLELHRAANPDENLSWHIAVTGSGMVNTAFHLTDHLTKHKYDLAVNLGVAGSFKPEHRIGDVVRIHKDRFGDWGAHEQDGFVDVFDMGLENPDKFPFDGGWIYEQPHPAVSPTNIPNVEAFTVNTVRESGLELARRKHSAAVETMEGAAFFFVCRRFNLPCLQLRGISNDVGERNKSKWKMQDALQNLGEYFVYKVIRKLRFEG